ncbi:GtrA family protein [Streptomyces sp. NPDC029003]|uniref:GtrA family protein n=1 Tax=Streptomyces sp. NPDC029003 TaxID=3155125 RepID=UPI0033E8C9E6
MSEDLWPPRALGRPQAAEAPASAPGGITVIIPASGESAYVRELLGGLRSALPAGPPCAVLLADGSPDGIPAVIEEAAADCPLPVSVLHRSPAEGGLGRAVAEGVGRAGTEWIVVMDAARRHPARLVPDLVGEGVRTGADLVVASRRAAGASRGAVWLAKGLFPRALRGIGDPLSGCFAVRRAALGALGAGGGAGGSGGAGAPGGVATPAGAHASHAAAAPKPIGRRILLELAVRCRPAKTAEVPCDVPDRPARESGSRARDGLRLLAQLAVLRSASPLARMIGFGLIGLSGFAPNLLALWLLTHAGVQYLAAEVLANQAGVVWNFLLIEALLFRERRHHRHWADRVGRFALLANADLLLRIPLIALFVARLGLGVLPATALALVTTFVLRFAATEALVYLPRGPRAAAAPRS